MNRKSKIKTTLDSLFTGRRINPEEQKTVDENKNTELEPASSKKAKEPVKSVKKPSETKIEKAKSVENSDKVQDLPVEILKPVVSEPFSQSPESKIVEDIRLDLKTKTAETNQKVFPVEIKLPGKVELDDDEHLVIILLGKELYGVTIHSVESIIKIQAITEVPRTASYVLGITNLRGTVVPVLDLRKRFNLEFADTTPNTRIIIVNAEGSKVGIVVDEVTEVLKVRQQSIQPPPPMSTTIESAFISGIARINDRLVILLDLEKVLAFSSRQYNRQRS